MTITIVDKYDRVTYVFTWSCFDDWTCNNNFLNFIWKKRDEPYKYLN